ncbi:MAG: DNA-binding protein [Candidatus Nanopelagicales bacterium]
MGLLQAARSRLATGLSRGATEEKDLQQVAEEAGATPINACSRGDVVTACGVLNSVIVRPVAGAPALEADLYDGTGHMTLVWLGRRQIAGIEAGRAITITGRMTCLDDTVTIFNPRYSLRPRGTT